MWTVSPCLYSSTLLSYSFYLQLNLMMKIRESIKADKFPEFVQEFFELQYPKGEYPQWAVDALNSVNITLIPPQNNKNS